MFYYCKSHDWNSELATGLSRRLTNDSEAGKQSQRLFIRRSTIHAASPCRMLCPLASPGKSIAGLAAKKLFGFNIKPVYSTGMMGKSSGRQTWLTPKLCQTTMSSFSIDRFCCTHPGKPSPPACWLG